MNMITLARFDQDHWRPELHCGIDDARLASAFKAVGIKGNLYAGHSQGRLQDLARQMARARAELIVHWVTPDLVGLTREFYRELLRLRPGTKILWWGPGSLLDADLGVDNIQLLWADTPEGVIAALRERCIISQAITSIPSPYLDGSLSVEQCRQFGFCGNQQITNLVAELEWLGKQGSVPVDSLKLDATRLNTQALADLVTTLSSMQCTFKLELHISAQAGPLEVPSGGCWSKIVVHGDVRQSNAVRSVPGVVIEYLSHDIRLKTLSAGRNGFTAMQTGLYPDLQDGAGIQHLELQTTMTSAARQDVYSWAGPHMRMVSAAVLNRHLQQAQTEERLTRCDPTETNGWPGHAYVVQVDETNAGRVSFDGIDEQPISFAAFGAKTDVPDGITTVLTIRTPDDVAELERELSHFHTTGRMTVPHPRKTVLVENTCRWMKLGACSALQLRRLAVDDSSNLTACRDSQHVGRVGDSYDQLLIRQKQEFQMAEVRRECSSCPVRDECSHCFHLPAQWGGQYCQIRKQYPLTSLFFELRAFPHLVRRYLVDDVPNLTLIVSGEGLPLQHYQGPKGEGRKGQGPLIVTILDQHFAWWRGTPKLVKISGPLSVMLEGWWSGASSSALEQALCSAFGTSHEQAASGVVAGLAKLEAGGLMSGR